MNSVVLGVLSHKIWLINARMKKYHSVRLLRAQKPRFLLHCAAAMLQLLTWAMLTDGTRCRPSAEMSSAEVGEADTTRHMRVTFPTLKEAYMKCLFILLDR